MWHLGHCNEAYLPTSRGFDSFFGFMNSQIYSESLLAPDAPYPVDFFNGTEVDKKVIGQYHGVREEEDRAVKTVVVATAALCSSDCCCYCICKCVCGQFFFHPFKYVPGLAVRVQDINNSMMLLLLQLLLWLLQLQLSLLLVL